MTQATQPRPRPLRRRDVPAIDKRELVSSDDFVSAIAQRWQDSVLAIIDVGKLLLGAKAALPHGEFGAMVESDKVPFGVRTAQRLMMIAEHSILANAHLVRGTAGRACDCDAGDVRQARTGTDPRTDAGGSRNRSAQRQTYRQAEGGFRSREGPATAR